MPLSLGSRLTRYSGFAKQSGWALAARILSTAFALVTILLLARGLAPAGFAFAAAVQVASKSLAAVNGFGLERQLQVARANDPNDPSIPAIFSMRLRYTYISAALWLVTTGLLWAVTSHNRWLAVMPLAVWLVAEQTTMTWNAVSIVDGHSERLVPSYIVRFGPPPLILGLGLYLEWDILLTWACAVAFGALLGYLHGYWSQEQWGQILVPRRHPQSTAVPRDFAFWWTKVGEQLKDLDVATVSMVNAHVGGLFALPARIIRPMNLVTKAAGEVAFPRIVRRRILSRWELYGALIAGIVPVVTIAAAIAVFANWIPRLVGDAYTGSIAPLRVHCLVGVLTGAVSILVIILQGRSEAASRFAGMCALLSATAQVAFSTLGAVVHGAVGASVGAALAQAVALSVLLVRADLQTRTERSGSHLPPSGV